MTWRHMGEWRYGSTFLDLCTRWGWVTNITPLPLYVLGKSPQYPLIRRLGGPQSRSGRCGEEKNPALSGIESGSSSPTLYRLSYPESWGRKCSACYFLVSVALFMFMYAADYKAWTMEYHSTRSTLDETSETSDTSIFTVDSLGYSTVTK
jgi:hypothetical protein